MKKRKKITSKNKPQIKKVFLLIILLLLFISGFFVYQNYFTMIQPYPQTLNATEKLITVPSKYRIVDYASVVKSQNGKKVAIVVQDESSNDQPYSSQRVMINGQLGNPYSVISGLQIDDSGDHVLYVGTNRQTTSNILTSSIIMNNKVIFTSHNYISSVTLSKINGQFAFIEGDLKNNTTAVYKNTNVIKRYSNKKNLFQLSHVVLSPDGKNIANRVDNNGKPFIALNGKNQQQYDYVSEAVFSQNDTLAYVAQKNGESFSVVNGKEGKHFKGRGGFPSISPDGKTIIYSLETGNTGNVVINDKEYTGSLVTIAFSTLGNHYAVVMQREKTDTNSILIKDGQESTIPIAITSSLTLSVSNDGKHVLYTIMKGKDDRIATVFFDQTEKGSYDDIVSSPTFSPDSQHYAFAIVDHSGLYGKSFVVLDGKKIPSEAFLPIEFGSQPRFSVTPNSMQFNASGTMIGYPAIVLKSSIWWVSADIKNLLAGKASLLIDPPIHAGWQKFGFSGIGISIEFPDTWSFLGGGGLTETRITTGQGGFLLSKIAPDTSNVTTNNMDLFMRGPDAVYISLQVSANGIGTTEQYKKSIESSIGQKTERGVVERIDDVKIGGQPAIKVTYKGIDYDHDYYILQNGLHYNFIVRNVNGKKENDEILNEILSAIRFTQD